MSAKRKGRSEGAPGRAAASRYLILLERIEEQNRATIEAVFASEQKLERKMEEMRRDLTLRLEAVEAVVKKNSEDIRKNSEDIRKNSEQIRLNTEELERHTEELRRIAAMLERKSDQAALIALEARVSALEKRVGL